MVDCMENVDNEIILRTPFTIIISSRSTEKAVRGQATIGHSAPWVVHRLTSLGSLLLFVLVLRSLSRRLVTFYHSAPGLNNVTVKEW